MLTRDALSFLNSPAGNELLLAAASERGDLLAALTRLRKRWPSEFASAAVELVELRKRAEVKFVRASEMFFTREGLEQSSGERVAGWRAARFPQGETILDLCCGVGGDSVALAQRGPVLAFDRDTASARCASANAWVYGANVSVACADVTRLRLRGGAAFWDPSRRAAGRRVRSGEDYTPPLRFYREVLASIPELAIKVSPSLSDDEIARTAADGARVEYVSDRGECKEAVLWFGRIGPAAERSASLVPAGDTLHHDPNVAPAFIAPPGEWLLEPDPAVIRAHLLPEACAATGAWRLDDTSAYLSSATNPGSPFVTGYRIVDYMPLHLKQVRARLRLMDRQVKVVKKRGVSVEPEEVIRKLGETGNRPATLILGHIAGSATAFVCEPIRTVEC